MLDTAMAKVYHVIMSAKAQALLFETSYLQHAHDWRVREERSLFEDKTLVPRMIDSSTDFIENPEVVADCILRLTDLVGRDPMMAGGDCGFSTFAGFGEIDQAICCATLKGACGQRRTSEQAI